MPDSQLMRDRLIVMTYRSVSASRCRIAMHMPWRRTSLVVRIPPICRCIRRFQRSVTEQALHILAGARTLVVNSHSFPVLLTGAMSCRPRSLSSVARSAIRRTRAQRAHFTVIWRGERMPGAWRTARPARAGAVIGDRWGASRLPAGGGTADRGAAPATGGLPVEGSGQAAAPGAGKSPVTHLAAGGLCRPHHDPLR